MVVQDYLRAEGKMDPGSTNLAAPCFYLCRYEYSSLCGTGFFQMITTATAEFRGDILNRLVTEPSREFFIPLRSIRQ
jgi:hypothetical protein